MPILPKPKHELYAQALAQGMTEVQAYENAGYSPHDGNASVLAQKPEIKARVAEIIGKAAERVEVTVASLLDEAEAARHLAMSIEQPSAAVAAIKEKGILSGKRIERAEQGRPGDFSKMSDDELDRYIETGAGRISSGDKRTEPAPGTNGAGAKSH